VLGEFNVRVAPAPDGDIVTLAAVNAAVLTAAKVAEPVALNVVNAPVDGVVAPTGDESSVLRVCVFDRIA